MIIFYNTTSGKITGALHGKVHGPEHLKMWVGDKKGHDRLIIEWKPIGKLHREEYEKEEFEDLGVNDEAGNPLFRKIVKKKVNEFREYLPEKHPKIIRHLHKNPQDLYKYKVDTNKKQLVLL
jgi:hypothetical protein